MTDDQTAENEGAGLGRAVVRPHALQRWLGPILLMSAVSNGFNTAFDSWWAVPWLVHLLGALWLTRLAFVPVLVVEDGRVLSRANEMRAKLIELTDLGAELEIESFQLTVRPRGTRLPMRLHRPPLKFDGRDLEWVEGGRAWLVERIEQLDAAAESAS